jgi:predicted Zn-dependent protease with MMP-like domain
MITISDEQFEKYVTESIDMVPEPYKSQIQNLAFFVEAEPTTEQKERLGLRPCQSLFGLYEGVPLPARNGSNANLLPDRITIFKNTHERHAASFEQLRLQVSNTVWHEVAHYFGLDHKRIHELERTSLS